MPEYRLYKFTEDGHITEPPIVEDLPNDETALKVAKQLVDGQAVEIWQGARIVAHLDPDE